MYSRVADKIKIADRLGVCPKSDSAGRADHSFLYSILYSW
jgi:hypothetical protein